MNKNYASRQADRVASKIASEIQTEVQKAVYNSVKYFGEAFVLKCFPDLLSLGIFPNIKEFTESMATFSAIEEFAKIKDHESDFFVGNPNIKMFDVCCGSSPRTAAVFAFRTSWNCFAIDPNVKQKWVSDTKIKRLETMKCRIQEIPLVSSRYPIVITNVHGHVKSEDILFNFDAPKILLLSMPCCHKIYPKFKNPDFLIDDYGIWSPEREIRIDVI